MFQRLTHLRNCCANAIEQRLVARRVSLPAPAHLADRQARSAANAGIADQQAERAGDDDWLDCWGLGVGDRGLGMILTNPQPPTPNPRSHEPDRLLIGD